MGPAVLSGLTARVSASPGFDIEKDCLSIYLSSPFRLLIIKNGAYQDQKDHSERQNHS